MHASRVLQNCLAPVIAGMDPRRVRSLWLAVEALLSVRRLVLMELARAFPGAERVRVPLKRLDRLLGNVHLHGVVEHFYGGLARWLVRQPQPVILVDWSDLKADQSLHVLRAAVPMGGRALTLFEQIHPQQRLGSAAAERDFLQRLRRLLPAGTRPIIVTDAGFRQRWFRDVRQLGWDYLGRVRGQVRVRLAESPWQPLRALYERADATPRAFTAALSESRPWACRLILLRRASRGRRARTHFGQPRRARRSQQAATRARDPWALATSLDLPPARIATLYAQRMQIEESFRDLKSTRYGAAFELSLTRRPERLGVLLLLLALATFVAYLTGLACRSPLQQAHCVPQPTQPRRRYSLIRIGWEALRRPSITAPPPDPRSVLDLIPIRTP
jgi:hypothetical protein